MKKVMFGLLALLFLVLLNKVMFFMFGLTKRPFWGIWFLMFSGVLKQIQVF